MKDLVFITQKGNPVTSSLLIADKFQKRHSDVLRAISNLSCSEHFFQRNFASVENQLVGSVKEKYYIITKSGFAFLVMGFTGKQAGQFKEDYINAFDKMEDGIKTSRAIPSNYPEALELAAHHAREIEAKDKLIAIQAPKAELADRLIDTETRIDIGQAAKLLKLPYGRNTFFKELRARGIFFKNRNEPKQEFVERGYFQLFMVLITTEHHGDLSKTKIVVTQKGLSWLAKQFNVEFESRLPKLNTAI